MRLFVSVDLPDALADPIADVQAEFGDAPGLRFTDPEQAHLTLKFLGETDADRVPELEDALETAVKSAGVEPFDATVGGLGVFPSLEYISVVWVGIERGGAEVTRLHEAIEQETTALGFDPEDHDFTPTSPSPGWTTPGARSASSGSSGSRTRPSGRCASRRFG